MTWFSTILLAALVLINAYAVVQAVMRGHSVESTLAWVFAILLLPWVGAVAYLLLANPSIRRTARRKRRTRHRVRETLPADDPSTAPAPEALPEQVDSLLQLAARLTEMSPSCGNSVELLSHDARAFQKLERALRDAKQSIWAEYYLIRNDETGHRFLDLLATKAAEGLEVRLLYDAVGSLGLDKQRLAAIRAHGGLTEEFLPLNPLRRRWAVHLRNHRKIVLVDGQCAFVGGMNVGDEYSGRARRRGAAHFRDSHLAICGPAVDDLAQTFVEDWSFATEQTLRPPTPNSPVDCASNAQGATVAVIPSGPDQLVNASNMVYFSGITSARRELYLASPYFVPNPPTLAALEAAALRGVDVRILVPSVSDVSLVNYAARTYFAPLLQSGVRIYEYQPSMLHAKTMVVDGEWGIVGSANVDFRSFRLNFELSALVVEPTFAEAMRQQFKHDLGHSSEVTQAMLSTESRLRRFRNQVARLLSPLL
ncbi:MAG: cardiolipin synthase [Planctomycetia bacterium]|nr:cardiolipin synthase [Planctomycetia bacterium]